MKSILLFFMLAIHQPSKGQMLTSFLKGSINFEVRISSKFDKQKQFVVSGNNIILTNTPLLVVDSLAKFEKNDWLKLLNDSTFSYATNLLLYQFTQRDASGYEVFKNKSKWYKQQRKPELVYWFNYIRRKGIRIKKSARPS
ncbi:hypothetical protein [Ferruginibacter sp.]